MLHPLVEPIYNAFCEAGVTPEKVEQDGYSGLRIAIQIDNGPLTHLNYFVNTDVQTPFVQARLFQLIRVREEFREKLYPVFNDLNSTYRYVRFVCDKEGDVNLYYDFPRVGGRPEQGALELAGDIVRIVNEAYPKLMRTLWS